MGTVRQRMTRSDREAQIVRGAIAFFADEGLGGNTRELAERLNITQPLIYKYFPTKNDLIERVFQEVFFDRFDPRWSDLITDGSRPIIDRLKQFYREYSQATYTYEWIRLYMSAALMGRDLNARYIGQVEQRILLPLCGEIRIYCGLPGHSVIPISRTELDHVWIFHGGFFYYAMRKHIYHVVTTEDFDVLVERAATTMLEGVRSMTSRMALQPTS
ncbi:TetR/AcrR family transcriptional regulator [Acidisoma sp.]|uniref:TetR/AcrR family transcriptional regulator n=1 Tax=Acidisoma sp. TaxID=1872115 RepID=UPI003AFF7E2B